MPPPSETSAAPRSASPARRALLIALGWTCFGLGVLGLVLPVVPTTPFMLVALWAFSASSERFHDWLYHHRVFGPPLQRWRRERALPAWVKAVALGSMAASLAWLVLGVRPSWYVVLVSAAIMLAGAAFILRIPSRPR